jgi:hypothetical protein
MQVPFTASGYLRPVKMPCCGFTVSYLGAEVLAGKMRCQFCDKDFHDEAFQREFFSDGSICCMTVREDEAAQGDHSAYFSVMIDCPSELGVSKAIHAW